MKTEYIQVSATLRLPERRANCSAAIRKITNALSQTGELLQINIATELSEPANHCGRVCSICGWVHDIGFSKIAFGNGPTILLPGLLPEIVGLVHRAHEKGLGGVSTKDEEDTKACGGYYHPCKAFHGLKRQNDYRLLFDTGRRGTISLRGAVGIIRNKSEIARNDQQARPA